MKKDRQALVIHCFFKEDGENTSGSDCTIPSTFYREKTSKYRRKFDNMATKSYNIQDEWPLISGGIICT